LHKNIGGEKSSEGVILGVKRGEKEKNKERKIRRMKTRGQILLKEGIL
jgi:hypothetical protein